MTLPNPNVASIATALLDGRLNGRRITRAKWRRVPYPTDEEALQVACRLIDLGVEVDDEQQVRLAVAMLKSDLTIPQIRAAALRPNR